MFPPKLVRLSVSSVMQKVVDDFFLKLFTEVGLVTGNSRDLEGDLNVDLDQL